jgi:hypothetical protein
MRLSVAECRAAEVLFARIDEVLKLIPVYFPRRRALILALKEQQCLVACSTSDAIVVRWLEVARILGKYIPAKGILGKKVNVLFGADYDD